MKILVTGATGFVGSHLCDLLNKSGHQILALVRNPKKAQEFNVPGLHVQGDLSNFDWVKQLPPDLDAVIHTAGIVHSFNDKEFFDVNAMATENLIKALSHYQRLNFLLVSSQAAGGPADANSPANEESKNAVSAYGHSKLKAEAHAHALSINSKWKVCIVRPPMVMGPRDPAVLDIFKMVKSGVIVSPASHPSKKHYSYVCVHDLVAFFMHALENDLCGIYYCAYPNSITLESLVNQAKLNLNKKTFNVIIPPALLKLVAGSIQYLGEKKLTNARLTADKVHELLPAAWICNSEKSQRDGFEYQWNLERTVEATLSDYKERGWL